MSSRNTGLEIAVIGLSGRFPGADNVEQLWQNLTKGRHGISFFAEDEMAQALKEAAAQGKKVVNAKGVLNNIEYFDPAFFGYSPKEAEVMDPQMRIFHECVWEALENAGYDPDTYHGLIGLYAGASYNPWAGQMVLSGARDFTESWKSVQFTSKDYLSTQIAYRLNLKGPCVVIDTACSTSLVAIDLACQGLLSARCDMALAGGIAITYHDRTGYVYQYGMIHSPDGYCRAFDAKAQGTVSGNGVGVVVLKRLEDALADGDYIYAIIRGSAINNDGRRKIGFTAPSIEGQAEVIRMAHLAAEVEAESISFVEAHGTGTDLGDPVEVEALKLAFTTSKRQYCALGSIKTNIGHLDTAAGVAGFIKTVLALSHKLLPASLHFENPNAKIDFENSPFYVNAESREWKNGKYPLRAGVSSFGIGGTNAHVILEEAPKRAPSPPGRLWQVVTLSTRSQPALDKTCRNLLQFLETHGEVNLADVAYTLQVGRKSFEHRRMFLAADVPDAIAILKNCREGVYDFFARNEKRVVFMFPGQGAQYLNMGLELYERVETFREEVDRCLDVLKSLGGEHSFFSKSVSETAIHQTRFAQPCLFVYEYALARLFIKMGVEPFAMLGHSIGEYVCACLAGVFTLEEALRVVSIRSKLMQEMRPGAMLSVPLSEKELQPLLNEVEIAAVNAPSQCVVSGSEEAISKFAERLHNSGKQSIRLRTSHAYHSSMMEPMLERFEAAFRQIQLKKPQIPYLSNVTGQWITSEDAADPAYWSKHLRSTVRFADAVNILRADPDTIFLEAGPGKALSFFVKQCLQNDDAHRTVNLTPAVNEEQSEVHCLLRSIGQLWVHGACINWKDFNAAEKRQRLPLPTYPFAKEYFPLDETAYPPLAGVSSLSTQNGMYFYVPTWSHSSRLEATASANMKTSWVVFVNDESRTIFADLRVRLAEAGHGIYTINIGTQFSKQDHQTYTINPEAETDYETVLAELLQQDGNQKRILFLWSLGEIAESESQFDGLIGEDTAVFYRLTYIARAIGRQKLAAPMHVTVVTNGVHSFTGKERLAPLRATILGMVKTIPLEYTNISVSTIDIDLSDKEPNSADHLFQEVVFASADDMVALRHQQRYVPEFEKLEINAFGHSGLLLREQGVYLITGGLGGIGLELAKMLAQRYRARLILTARSPLPPKAGWHETAANHHDDKMRSLISTLIALEDSGAEVLALSADVADRTQMAQVRKLANERFGQIHGVIHCAGVPGGELIQTLTLQKTEAVFLPKIKGSLVLDSVFADTPLDFFILCSSLNSFIGAIGQASYCAANAFMDAFAHYKNRRGRVFTLSINWDAWRETGMAAAARKNLFHRQVVKLNHAIFEGYDERDNERIYYFCLSPKQNWVLDEHRILGKATLPGTAYLELAHATVQHFRDHLHIELQQVVFLAPLVVDDTEEKPVRIIIKKAESDFEFRVQSQFQNDEWQDHCHGRIRLLDPITPTKIDIAQLAAQCSRREIDLFDRNGDFFNSQFQKVGLRWSNFRRLSFGEHCGLAKIELASEFSNDVAVHSLHPAILDTATGFLSREVNKKDGYLPFFYKSVRIFSSLPPAVYSFAKYKNHSASPDQETMAFDIVITDDAGGKLVEIEEYTFKRARADSYRRSAAPAGELENMSLIIATPGNLDTLKYVPLGRTNAGPGEVEIEVYATGLNFKEVLMALGMIPAPEGESFKFGLECAGKIVSCGEGVADFKAGDEVIALGAGCFNRYVTLPATHVAHKPHDLSMVEAATVPVPFLTAYHALITMGRLSKEEKVLIHCAAGGVGMAAVQIARWVGAEIFATAGNPEKREYLQSLGIKYVMDSRSLNFADEIMKYTKNQGVDVLLNSLSGEFVNKGLSIMASGGRFIEIGVRDIFEDKQIGMGAFAGGLSFIAIDEIKNRDVIQSALQKIVQHLQKKDFTPLQPNIFKRDDVTAAFKFMAQAKHIGKIVVAHKDSTLQSIRRTASNVLQDGLLSKQGVMAFRKILEGYPINNLKAPAQIVVTSREDLLKKSRFDNHSQESLLKTVKPAQKSIRPRPQLSATYITPRNDVERSVAEVIQDYLGYDKLGIDDNFFELGLSSLDIIQINEKLKTIFHRDLAIVTMFSYPTIGALAEFLLSGAESSEKPTVAEKMDFAKSERLLRHSIDTFRKL